jgi:hypothetical protein
MASGITVLEDYARRRVAAKVTAMLRDCGDAMKLAECTKRPDRYSVWSMLALIQNDITVVLAEIGAANRKADWSRR